MLNFKMTKIAILCALFLSACVEEKADYTTEFVTICLDKVSYWYRPSGGATVLAPRINPETLGFVLCEPGV